MFLCVCVWGVIVCFCLFFNTTLSIQTSPRQTNLVPSCVKLSPKNELSVFYTYYLSLSLMCVALTRRQDTQTKRHQAGTIINPFHHCGTHRAIYRRTTITTSNHPFMHGWNTTLYSNALCVVRLCLRAGVLRDIFKSTTHTVNTTPHQHI